MNDSLLVCRFQSLGDLFCYGQRLIERNRSTRDSIGERFAFYRLHGECAAAASLFETVDARCSDDSGRQRPHLALERCKAAQCLSRNFREEYSAASRFNRVSRARYTSPLLPAPMTETITYGPRRVPMRLTSTSWARVDSALRSSAVRRQYAVLTSPNLPHQQPSG